MSKENVLVLGASGYIGKQLVGKLLDEGHIVHAAGRSPDKLKKFSWAGSPDVRLVAADVLDKESLRKACTGIDAVYYLVHSMNPQQKDFEAADRRGAKNMVEAAQQTKVGRIIYLGGLGEEDGELSKHLRSRIEVSKILHSGEVPVTTLRAAMIIGKDSASFGILRYLVERLPVMITPKWVGTLSQPIAIDNVLNYLVGCLQSEETKGETYDIGGPDIISYRQMMDIYAEEAGLRKRLIIPVPVLTPRLSSYWIHLVTPYPSYIARPLAEGLRNKVICHDHRIRKMVPQELLDCRGAIRKALGQIKEDSPAGKKKVGV